MFTNSRRIKETLELFIRQGRLKGKIIGNNFALSALTIVNNNLIVTGNFILHAIVYIPLILALPTRGSRKPLLLEDLLPVVSNPIWQICFFLMLVFIIANKLYKSYLVINFNERKIYSTNYLLSIDIGKRCDEIDITEVTAVCIDTIISRKLNYKNKELLVAEKFNLDVLAQRKIALLKKYYHFSSVIMLILKNGHHINISIDKASDEMLEKYNETAKGLSEAFEIPLIACNHEQKIDFDSIKNCKNNKNAEKECLPQIIPIFSEDDFKKMEQEAIGGSRFISPFEED